ncbi:MAG: hypothetical protein IJT73_00245 [Selenomonadaceae bacterium]|nr:hypothetical protein [Selenomonadaceae bacterium]
MKINPVNGWSQNFAAYENSQGNYSKTFSKVLDNVKHGRPADYDEETMQTQKTQTVTQILSDGSTLITVYDEGGRVLSQTKTSAVNPDSNAQIVDTKTENIFGLNELSNFNLILR